MCIYLFLFIYLSSYLFITFIYLFITFIYLFIYRGMFRSQTSDNMDRLKAEMCRVRESEKRREEERRSKKSKSQKKEDPG